MNTDEHRSEEEFESCFPICVHLWLILIVPHRTPPLMTPQYPGRRPASLVSRRHALKSFASGFGYLAFAGLAHEAAARDAPRGAGGLAARQPHFPARAKRVILLCMNGGPSHV